jgi:tripartite-type tricarboxylate transporter receptor subunit TctC
MEGVMKPSLSLCFLASLSLFGLSANQQFAQAETYPAKPVKVIVPYAAGSAADVIGRIVAQKLSDLSGGQFDVENLPGAGGAVGTGAAARAPADGYTILVMNQDFVVQPLVKAKVPYDPFKSFTPVGSVAAAPETISVHPSVPASNMKELIALLKANPGKYTYASPGYGTSPHIACERLFKLTHGVEVVQVPFQGGGPAVTATLGGHTHILHITLPLVAEHVKSGGLRGLAVADKRRSQLLPDVPTLHEAGIPNHEVGYWVGILVPTETPKDVVDLLNRHIGQIVSLPDVKDRLATLGFSPFAGAPEDLAAHIKVESAEWSRVVREANININ